MFNGCNVGVYCEGNDLILLMVCVLENECYYECVIENSEVFSV